MVNFKVPFATRTIGGIVLDKVVGVRKGVSVTSRLREEPDHLSRDGIKKLRGDDIPRERRPIAGALIDQKGIENCLKEPSGLKLFEKSPCRSSKVGTLVVSVPGA